MSNAQPTHEQISDLARLTVITPDDEPQTRWNEFIRLVRAGYDVAHVAELLGIPGWRS